MESCFDFSLGGSRATLMLACLTEQRRSGAHERVC